MMLRASESLWIQLLAGVICTLSILGSLAIILTYVLVKDIRSKARELLVHISLMDIMYSTANLVGLVLPYHKHLDRTRNVSSATYHTYDRICQVQAAIGVYGTIGSVLWTLGLAVYLYYRIVSRDANITKWILRVLYVVCYVLPLYPTLWLLLAHKLGYWPQAPLSGGGWCSVKDDIEPLVDLMTYDVWIWLGVILVPLYVSIHVRIREEIHQFSKKQDYQYSVITNPTFGRKELKLLFVPVVFIVLRVWDLITSALYVYCDNCTRPHHQLLWLQVFQAIGDSGQGLFNFIIFFIFQPKLRALLMKCICCKCRRLPPVHDNDDDDDDDDDEMDDSTSLQYRSRASSQFSQYTT